MKIKELFDVSYGNAGEINQYETGNIPYVSSGSKNNGVVGFVDTDEELLKPYCITVASKGSIGSAFVQPLDFIASHDNVSVLQEKEGVSLSVEEKYFVASYINRIKWRFSYGRTLSKTRIQNLDLPEVKTLIDYPEMVKKLLPKKKKAKTIQSPPDYKHFDLNKLFTPIKGKGDYLINLEKGNTPLISATNENNGVLAYVDSEPIFKAPLMTVERISGTAFVQLEDFVTVPDDILVLKPLSDDFNLEFLIYISALINKKRWKYCYGRKLSKNRLMKMKLHIPVDEEGNTNYSYINELVKNCYGWSEISNYLC